MRHDSKSRLLISGLGLAGLLALSGCTAAQQIETPTDKELQKAASPAASPGAAASPLAAASPGASPAAALPPRFAPSPSPVTAASPSPSPIANQQVTYRATEFQFQGPDTIPAGWTAVTLINEGDDPHHITFLALAEDVTFEEFVQQMAANPEQPPPGLFTEEGGPNAVIPGAQTTAVLNLAPGDYVMADFIPGPEGTPHIASGMLKLVTVEESPDTNLQPPRESFTIEGIDFAFNIPDNIPTGPQVIEFDNQGQQHHEVLMVQLQEGATVEDFIQSLAPGAQPGPPPGLPIGGITAIEAGQQGYFTADLVPGTYGLICFLPNVEGDQGQPHYELGMQDTFTVQ